MARRREGLLVAAGLMLAVFSYLQGVAFCQTQMQLNITKILEAFPDYSLLNQWFTTTKVDQEVNNRSTITVLAAPNSAFSTYLSSVDGYNNPDKVADTLRYQVLLQFFSPTELAQLPTNGTNVPTLLQTTGRANATQGFIMLYRNGTSYHLGHKNVDSVGNETVVTNVTQSGYLYSVLEVDRVFSPVSTAALTPAPAPAPANSSSPAPTPAPGTPTPPSVSPSGAPISSPADVPATFPPPTDASGNFGSPKERMGMVALLCAILLSSMVAALS